MQEAVLALRETLEFQSGRIWKRYDFAVMDALYEQGLITDPHGRNESVRVLNRGWLGKSQVSGSQFLRYGYTAVSTVNGGFAVLSPLASSPALCTFLNLAVSKVP